MYRFLTFLFLLSLFTAYSQNPEYAALTIDQELIDNADSVVREEVITHDLTREETLITTVHKVVTVFNKAGNADVQAYAFYDDDRKIKNISAVIYDFTGREVNTFKERDFKDVSAVSGGTLYADDRIMVLDYTPTRYPYTVVFDSEVKSRTTAFIAPWVPVANYKSSTQHAKFEILYRADDELNLKEDRLKEYNVAHTHVPGRDTWEVSNIKGIKKEYLSPDLEEVMPRVKCALKSFYLKGVNGTATNWKSFGGWMNTNLIQGTDDLPQETIDEIKAMVGELPTDRAKAKAVYKYVQDKVRYISVQVGIGGWKPMLAEDVDRLGYGDCKALSNYTRSLLEVAGVPSYYTVLYGDSSKRSIDTDFIAMQGNHVILGVPLDDGINWLECTSQEVPFGYLGDFTDDRDVLLIKEEGGEIAHTKVYPASENKELLKAEINLTKNGGMTGLISAVSTGVFYGDHISLQRKDPDELKKYYLRKWGNISRLQIEDIDLKNFRDSIVFKENIKVSTTSYLTSVGQDYLLSPNKFGVSQQQIPTRYDTRKTPFIIQRGSTQAIVLTYKLPLGYSIDMLPEPVSISTDFGSYTVSFSQEDGSFKYMRSFILNEGDYAPEQYEDFRDFYKKIVKQDAQKLLIKTQT